MWIRTWDFKLPLRENCAPHVLHLNVFSPLWMRTCCINPLLRKNRLPQVSHLNRFSRVEVFTLTAILKIPVSIHHTFRLVPQRRYTLVSSVFFCVRRCVTTETATLHDSMTLSDVYKPPLKFLSNVNVKTQSLRHHLYVKRAHVRHTQY